MAYDCYNHPDVGKTFLIDKTIHLKIPKGTKVMMVKRSTLINRDSFVIIGKENEGMFSLWEGEYMPIKKYELINQDKTINHE